MTWQFNRRCWGWASPYSLRHTLREASNKKSKACRRQTPQHQSLKQCTRCNCRSNINKKLDSICGDRPFFTAPLEIRWLIQSLATDGVVSMPLLTDSARQALLAEAETFVYEPEVKTIGTGDRMVRTEYSACASFAPDGLYAGFQQAFQSWMDEALAALDADPFATPLHFTELVLQRYLPGELGITPHRDSLRAVNLIALVNLSGDAEFYHCEDRQGAGAVRLDTTPGYVIFLRAPGFLNRTDRPFHYLTNIRTIRYSLGLRQRVP